MRLSLLVLALPLAACGGAEGPPPAAAGQEGSNQNAPPPRPGLTVAEQAERLIALVVEGQADPGARDRLRGEIAALPLDDPDVIQGRSTCLEAWRVEAEGEDVTMARAACRAVIMVLAGRHAILDRVPMGPQPRPAPSVGGSAATAPPPTPLSPRPDGSVDQELQGELTDSDPRVEQDDSPYDEYTVAVPSGWTIEVDLRSDAFDSYVWLIAPDGQSVVQDDDGGGGLNSHFVFQAHDPGEYTVRANSYDGAGRGAYRLHVRVRP